MIFLLNCVHCEKRRKIIIKIIIDLLVKNVFDRKQFVSKRFSSSDILTRTPVLQLNQLPNNANNTKNQLAHYLLRSIL